MKLKNYQEDVVLHVAEIVLDDRPDVEKTEKLIHDVAAFALNRLPPRYIMSERGITRFAADHWLDDENRNNFQNLVGVLMLVNEAVDVITKRRKNGAESIESVVPETVDLSEGPAFWHSIPCIVGRVADADSGKYVSDVEISFSVDGELAQPADDGWLNPYATNDATNGFFSFLPAATIDTSEDKEFSLEVGFKHPAYQPLSITRMIQSSGGFERDDLLMRDIVNLETTSLIRV